MLACFEWRPIFSAVLFYLVSELLRCIIGDVRTWGKKHPTRFHEKNKCLTPQDSFLKQNWKNMYYEKCLP